MASKRTLPIDNEKLEFKLKQFKFSIKMRLKKACMMGNIETVKHCMKFDLDLNERIFSGMSLLQIASHIGHADIVEELLKHAANVDDKTEDSEFTALHIATQNGHPKLVAKLLENGAKIDIHVGNKPEGCNGANCDNPCYPGGNALYLASLFGHVEIVKMLIQYGAAITSKCSYNPLNAACEMGHLEVVKELLKAGARINEKGYIWDNFPLHMAVANGQIEVVQELIKWGADVNLFDDYFGTPINIAARDGNLALVKELLKHGANPYQHLDEHNNDYLNAETPLHGADMFVHQSIIEEILLHHENDAFVDDENKTPLHYASEIGNAKAVKKLLERGCSVNVKTTNNKIPLHFALDWGCSYHDDALDTLTLLVKHGADVNAQDENGNSALHLAVEYGHYFDISFDNDKNIPLERILNEASNINFNLKNEDGKTALQSAIDSGDTDSARMIAKKMCPKSSITHSIYPLKCFIKYI